MSTSAQACAHPNIALVKYWGKADAGQNLPATPSLSITLSALQTRTRVRLAADLTADEILLNGLQVQDAKISQCLDRLRALAGTRLRAQIDTRNNFPTAAGLASSASGFAALVTALDQALGLQLSLAAKAEQARLASASAARSLFGGYASLVADQARQVASADYWPLAVVVAVCSTQAKAVSSSAGMAASSTNSPLYDAWVAGAPADFAQVEAAVLARDFPRLAERAEANCLKMHAVMLSTQPALLYWQAATLACMEQVRRLREQGVPVFFTIDAGPQVKAVCLPAAAPLVAQTLAQVPGVAQVLRAGLGQGARLCTDHD